VGIEVDKGDILLFSYWKEGRERWKEAWETREPQEEGEVVELQEYRSRFWAEWARSLGYEEDTWVGRGPITLQDLKVQGINCPREDRATMCHFSLAVTRYQPLSLLSRLEFWRSWAKGELFKRSAGLWTRFATAHQGKGWDTETMSSEYYKSLVLTKRAEKCRAIVVGHLLYIPAEVNDDEQLRLII